MCVCVCVCVQVPKISRADGTYAVIIAPTRELCLQIQDVAVQLLKRYIWLVSHVGTLLAHSYGSDPCVR